MSVRLLETTEPEDFRVRVVIPLPHRGAGRHKPAPRPVVDIVIPVHNQDSTLEAGVRRLHAFVQSQLPFSARITIADCASSDSTRSVARRLVSELHGVELLPISEAHRGRAVAAAWLTSPARVVADMDLESQADLSTLLPVLAPVITGRSEVSIGREHNLLHRLAHRARFGDPHRGFKAVRAEIARRLIPDVVDRSWWFDIELLERARRAGLRIARA